MDIKKIERHFPIIIFFISLIFFSALLWYLRRAGMLGIDDAYITFRYAENLARGKGFVYNSGERVLGTTTPVFCLLLAFLRLLKIPVLLSADLLNVFSSALSASLIYLIGRELKNKVLGWVVVLLYILFPHFWMNVTTGMETMFTVFLCLLLVWLDLKGKPMLLGIVGGLLLLTRIDALALVASVFIIRFFKAPKQAIFISAIILLTILPWLIFSFFYFDSIIPQSILAKKLIHPLSAVLVLKKYLIWFVGLKEEGAGLNFSFPHLIVYSFFSLLGVVRVMVKERWALVFILWILFFLAGMAIGESGPFFWYKVPMLSGYIFLVGMGLQWFCSFWERVSLRMALSFYVFIPLALILWGLSNYPYDDFIRGFTEKEKANQRLARIIKQNFPDSSKILAGETGIIGYELLDYYLIDSAGLCSQKVYELRLKDRQKLLALSKNFKWDWWGTIDWVIETINYYQPEFILSDIRYIYLKKVISAPAFSYHYQIVAQESTSESEILLLQRMEK